MSHVKFTDVCGVLGITFSVNFLVISDGLRLIKSLFFAKNKFVKIKIDSYFTNRIISNT